MGQGSRKTGMNTALDASVLGAAGHTHGAWTAALLLALARDERAGRRPERLTEPGLATWARLRGRLDTRDLLGLLFEDAAVIHPIPFDAAALGEPLDPARLPEAVARNWVAALSAGPAELTADGAAYIAAQARRLGVATRLARSELHVVKPHHRVLELPGSGGQLAHHLITTQGDLSLGDGFTIACHGWRELALAGIVALDLAAPGSGCIQALEPGALARAEHPLRRRAFDFVIGPAPDKGGAYGVTDQLALWYPGARVLLV